MQEGLARRQRAGGPGGTPAAGAPRASQVGAGGGASAGAGPRRRLSWRPRPSPHSARPWRGRTRGGVRARPPRNEDET